MKIILTGTAHCGKTTLLNELGRRGYKIVEEAETPIVKELREKLGIEECKKWIMNNYEEFKDQVAKRQKKLEEENSTEERIFYDRSAICYIAYCKLRGSRIPASLTKLSEEKPGLALFLESIGNFDERRESGRFMTKEESKKLARLILEEYKTRGIKIIRIPVFSNDEQKNISLRIEEIEKHIRVRE
jgi:predicted ATPase